MKVLLSIVGCFALWLLSSQAMAQAPIITCPSDITISCSQPADTAITGSATAVDDDDPNPIISYTDVMSGECPLIITRTWVAQDHYGHTSEPCTQIITVVDDQPPVIVCQDQNISVGDQLPPPPSVTDCDSLPSVVGSDSMIAPNVVLRRWLVTDKCGNVSSCSQRVRILNPATIMVASQNVGSVPITLAPGSSIKTFFSLSNVSGVLHLAAPAKWSGQDFEHWIVCDTINTIMTISDTSISLIINAYDLPTHTHYGIFARLLQVTAVYHDSCGVDLKIDPGMLRTFDAIKGGSCNNPTVEHIVQLADCVTWEHPYCCGAYCGLDWWKQWFQATFVLPQKCMCRGSGVDSVKMVMLDQLGEIARLGQTICRVGQCGWDGWPVTANVWVDNYFTFGKWDLAAFCSDGSHSILKTGIDVVGDKPYYPDGIVTNTLTGLSVPGIVVSLYRWIRSGVYKWYAETTTRLDGTYDFGDDIPSGTYKLRAINPDRILFPQEVWSDAFFVPSSKEGRSDAFGAASPIPYMEFSLVPGNNDITAPTIDLDTTYNGGVMEVHGTFTDNETGIYARTTIAGSDQNIELSFGSYTIGSDTVSFVAKQMNPALPATTTLRCIDMVGNVIEFSIAFPPYLCGDANADAIVDISDVVYLIAYIFSGGSAPSPLLAGDANCDQTVDISDVVYLIAYIFSGGLAPCEGCK